MRLWINIQSFESPCRELSVECGNNKLGMLAVGSQVAGADKFCCQDVTKLF